MDIEDKNYEVPSGHQLPENWFFMGFEERRDFLQTLSRDQLEKMILYSFELEMRDFFDLMKRMTTVVCEATDGRASKLFYSEEVYRNLIREAFDRHYNYGADELREWIEKNIEGEPFEQTIKDIMEM